MSFTTKDTKDTEVISRTGFSFVPLVCLVSLVAFFLAKPASAQIYESIGIRAQGMGGAFVAVSDDATTTWWNPAGLASGGYFNGILEVDHIDDPAGSRARAFALSVPALGLSYYRLAVNTIQAASPTGSAAENREDQSVLSQFGVTVGQSIGAHLILGSTVKLVHGLGDTRPDVDVGTMAAFGGMRLALAAKNLRAPDFSNSAGRVELSRQVRAGASVRAGSQNRAEIVGALDADLTTTATAAGDERHLATGVEAWLRNRTIGLRAGVGINTVGPSRRSGSAGASVALRAGISADGQITRGSDQVRNGWGLALRVTF